MRKIELEYPDDREAAPMDQLRFTVLHGASEVSLFASRVRMGRTSVQIHVEAWRRSRDSDDSQMVTEATFTFVALDEEGRPRLVQS